MERRHTHLYAPSAREPRVERAPDAPRSIPPGAREDHTGGLAVRAARAAFINRDFALLWWGQTISSVGDYAWDTALILWIATTIAARQSWSPLAVSGAILAAFLPQIVIAPIAGVFVDRWDKRRTMIITTAIQAALAALLIIPVLTFGVHQAQTHPFLLLGVVYADIVLLTTCAQFFLPAQLALIKDIVPEPKQDQGIEMVRAIQALGVVVGPPVAAALVFGLGVQWALLMNALSFAVSFAAAVLISAPPATRSVESGSQGRFWREFTAGLRYTLGHATLRTILVAEILTWLGFGALQSLGYFFITRDLRAPPSSYGTFAAVFGLGAILGGALVTIFGRRIGLRRILWLALLISGIFVAIMSHLTRLEPALVAAFIFGVSATAILISSGPLALDTSEKDFVGRVMTVLDPVGRLAALISVLIAGSLVGTVLHAFHASVLGVTFDGVNIVFTGTGALIAAGGVYTWRHMHGLRDPDPTQLTSSSPQKPAQPEHPAHPDRLRDSAYEATIEPLRPETAPGEPGEPGRPGALQKPRREQR